MFENTEKLNSISKAEFFGKMLSELSWSQLRNFVQNNAQMSKACLFGGMRLDPQNRGKLEERAVREADKSGYQAALCNSIFTIWYPVHETLNNNLETHFKSDAYKKYQQDNGLGEDDFVLTDEEFDKFFSVNELSAWKILLLFSPLKFSESQADKILDCTQGSAELLDKIASLEKELAEAGKKASQTQGELDKCKAQLSAANDEILNLKKSNRETKQNADALQQKFESSQGEVKRLNAKLAEAGSAAAGVEKSVLENAERKVAQAAAEATRINQELQTWKSKYEEQRVANRQLEDAAAAARKESANMQNDTAKMNDKLTAVNKFIDALLARIDWASAGSSMKLNPTMRRNFNSLVKKLNYDENANLTLEGTLPDFWKKLTDAENGLVKKLAESNVLEVQEGDMDEFWNDVDEDFLDVQLGLEAKLFLLETIHEIFFQTFTADDLKKPHIPTSKKK